jgi:uncharacterized protein YciI/uncharacterized protein YndB with AHSA1/START domain
MTAPTSPAPQPPLRRELVVDADPGLAFAVFTERIGSWWPLGSFGVYGAQASVAFRDGEIVETAPGRPDSVWGRVTTWEPPDRLTFTWHPGAAPERATLVAVTFVAQGEQTLVRLEHTGWEVYADPAAARTEYGNGWPTVLGCFGHCVQTGDLAVAEAAAGLDSQAEPDADSTWVALLHRPGPDAGISGAGVMADPRFGDHVAFLNRMQDKGFLVAAGPLADEVGAGMTVLRLPGADRLDEARRLAETDDISVASGFFTVTVRPWQVVMNA